jgi:glutamate 5-kinase
VPTPRHADLRNAQRLVVKVGSSSLTTADGALDNARLGALVDVIAARRSHGTQIVLVSSGAIAAGLTPLGLLRRPRDLATQQAAASVGQGALVAAYSLAFGVHDLTVGQVLLTADDVTRRTHYANARRTLCTRMHWSCSQMSMRCMTGTLPVRVRREFLWCAGQLTFRTSRSVAQVRAWAPAG